MIQDLLNSWYAMRLLLQKGIEADDDQNEDEELEAISVFHEHCFDVAEEGRLDQALEMALKVFEADPAGDFYRDIMEVVSVHGVPIGGEDWEGMAKTRLFTIPVVGRLENLSRLHEDTRIADVFRDTGFAQEGDHIFLLGTTTLSEGARLSPQSVWNITNAGTHALATLSSRNPSSQDLLALRDMGPFITVGPEDHDESTHSGLLMGLRFEVEEDDDPITMDPLYESALRSEYWRNALDLIPGIRQDCVLLSPMPWKEGIIHGLLVASQVGILREAGRDHDTEIGRVIVSSHPDHVDLSWFDTDNTLLGTHQVLPEISFWALSEILYEIKEQGIAVEVLTPRDNNLATMASPGRLLN